MGIPKMFVVERCCYCIKLRTGVYIIEVLLLLKGLSDLVTFAYLYSLDEKHYYNTVVPLCDKYLAHNTSTCIIVPGKASAPEPSEKVLLVFTYHDRTLLSKASQLELFTKLCLGFGCVVFCVLLLIGLIKKKPGLLLAFEIYLIIMIVGYLVAYSIAAQIVSGMTTWWLIFTYIVPMFGYFTILLYFLVVVNSGRMEMVIELEENRLVTAISR